MLDYIAVIAAALMINAGVPQWQETDPGLSHIEQAADAVFDVRVAGSEK